MSVRSTILGVTIACSILVLWASSLAVLLTTSVHAIPPLLLPLAVLWQMFLYTGLFITAHDAMHGTVAPLAPALNRAIGILAALFYALFDYRRLHTQHRLHHKHPAREGDPDYHDGAHTGFVRWYVHFMLGYLSWQQLIGMAIAFNILQHLAGIPIANIVLFWVAPALLSTVQLFYFGTYLPHRQPDTGYDNPHHAHSNNYSVWWSFLTCYHFGYHFEHHQHPSVPWWRLPSTRALRQ